MKNIRLVRNFPLWFFGKHVNLCVFKVHIIRIRQFVCLFTVHIIRILLQILLVTKIILLLFQDRFLALVIGLVICYAGSRFLEYLGLEF